MNTKTKNILNLLKGALRLDVKKEEYKLKYTEEDKLFMSSKKEKRRTSLHDVYDHTIGFTEKERKKALYWLYWVLFVYMALGTLGILMLYYMIYSEDRYGKEFSDLLTVMEVSIALGLFVLLQLFKIIFVLY